MDVGSILEGEEEEEEGLIDYVGTLSEATKCLTEMIKKSKSKNNRKKQKS